LKRKKTKEAMVEEPVTKKKAIETDEKVGVPVAAAVKVEQEVNKVEEKIVAAPVLMKKRNKKRSKKVVLPEPEEGALQAMFKDNNEVEEATVKTEPPQEEVTEEKKVKKPSQKLKLSKGKNLVNKAKALLSNVEGEVPEKLLSAELTKKSGADVVSDEAVTGALEYLKLWKNDRKKWRFKKVKQIILIKNMYKCDKIDDDHFEMLLAYLESAKGMVVTKTLEKAVEYISKDEDDKEDEVEKRMKMIVKRLKTASK